MEGQCYCGRAGIMKISWIDLNPGRRYSICSKFQEARGCIFFSLLDPPNCDRCRVIIHGLLRRLDKYEDQIKKLKDDVRRRGSQELKLWLGLGVSWLFMAWLFA